MGKLDKPRYTGLFDAFSKIKAAEGMSGFYAGATPAIQRAALVNLGELTTYDSAKKFFVGILGDNLLCHLSSAICSGFVASLCYIEMYWVPYENEVAASECISAT